MLLKKAVERVDPKSSRDNENILKDCCHCSGAKSCPSPCEPTDCCPAGSSVHGISQANVLLKWVAFSPPGNLSNAGIKPTSPALAGDFFTAEPPRKPPRRLFLIQIFIEQLGKYMVRGEVIAQIESKV